jgi:hypothetical protein
MRAFNKEEVEVSLKKVGAKSVQWFSPKESGYFQPVILAR